MNLVKLEFQLWSVLSIKMDDGDDVVTEYMNKLDNTGQSGAVAIQNALEKLARFGPEAFDKKKFHYIDQGKRKVIYQITCGGHRISCFFGSERRLIVCAGAYQKGSNTKFKKFVKHAEQQRLQYFEDFKNSQINITEG